MVKLPAFVTKVVFCEIFGVVVTKAVGFVLPETEVTLPGCTVV